MEHLDPLDALAHDHAFQLELCDLMEGLADSLPDGDMAIAATVVPVLRYGVTQHMRFEEEVLFPALRAHRTGRPEVQAVTAQLAREHSSDIGFLEEVADALDAFVAEGTVGNPEMLGYMLRLVFESQRRHIEWENKILIPLARDVLTVEDKRHLQRALSDPAMRCNSRTFFKEYRRALNQRRASGH